jgi:hypothetical protein
MDILSKEVGAYGENVVFGWSLHMFHITRKKLSCAFCPSMFLFLVWMDGYLRKVSLFYNTISLHLIINMPPSPAFLM